MEKRVVVAAAADSHSRRRNCLFSSLKRILGQRTKKNKSLQGRIDSDLLSKSLLATHAR